MKSSILNGLSNTSQLLPKVVFVSVDSIHSALRDLQATNADLFTEVFAAKRGVEPS